MEKEQYQPSEEEIKKTEGMATQEEKENDGKETERIYVDDGYIYNRGGKWYKYSEKFKQGAKLGDIFYDEIGWVYEKPFEYNGRQHEIQYLTNKEREVMKKFREQEKPTL